MNVKFKGNPVKIVGDEIKIGEFAPSVKLKGNDLGYVIVGGKKDKIQVLNVVPSLDTPVCAIQTKTFNQKAASLPNVEVFVISMDLPFAQGRFCSVEGIANLKALSDYRNKEFGKKYGVLIDDSPLSGLLTRAVFIIDTEGKIIYKEVCEEITKEPDYEAALNAIK
ncbi:thiol peroxidase [Helicobacter sp. MIT 14-3879]|uniref:thiol peroxidase n=1 Tax=Helicobacter sp. MIT 14-3879 TaxID=2040649 RepID=UPI000E1EA32E|nr:thiol peroxidase [Helicobacter sp. MIT 14-3879]RDU65134.1 thiol peroxidase [Helicobacter sp. MIT 14-3879]